MSGAETWITWRSGYPLINWSQGVKMSQIFWFEDLVALSEWAGPRIPKEVEPFNLPYPETRIEGKIKGGRVPVSAFIEAKQMSPSSMEILTTLEGLAGVGKGVIELRDGVAVGTSSDQRVKMGYILIWALTQLLSCSNVVSEKITRSKEPNTRWGDPLKGTDIYHTLTVDVTTTEDSPEGSLKTGSPRRQHWRRGHIRRLRDGRKVWVQPHLAGDPDRGFVDKDYRVKNHPSIGA